MLFEKIKKGEYDADDPIWDQVSLPAKDLVVRQTMTGSLWDCHMLNKGIATLCSMS